MLPGSAQRRGPSPIVMLVVLFAASVAAVGMSNAGTANPLPPRPIIMGLVALPGFLSLMLALGLVVVSGKAGLQLHTHRDTEPHLGEAVQKSWAYERDRYGCALSRAQFYAIVFGVVATLFLACSMLLLRWGASNDKKASVLALSIVAATVTAFLIGFVKMAVRLSGYDLSARAFSWSTRSVALSVVADVGLLLALPINDDWSGILLGILTGIAGEHAMTLLLEKAPKALGLAPALQPRGPSPLLFIDGIMAEHVDRLEEEGVLSIHDLALVPTARLFFNTPYGLQMICDWQDQALLLVRVGLDRATDLLNQMGIRGAIALRATAQHLIGPGPAYTKAIFDTGNAYDDPRIRDALQRALKFDKETPLDPMLTAIRDDEATLRVLVHWQSIVLEPAQFQEPAQAGPAADFESAQAGVFSCAAQDGHGQPITVHYGPRPH